MVWPWRLLVMTTQTAGTLVGDTLRGGWDEKKPKHCSGNVWSSSYLIVERWVGVVKRGGVLALRR